VVGDVLSISRQPQLRRGKMPVSKAIRFEVFAARWFAQVIDVPLKRIPIVPACYGFFSGDRCLYIGKAVNLRARISLHQWRFGRINSQPFPEIQEPLKIKAVILPLETLVSREYELITELRPEMNIQHANYRKSLRISLSTKPHKTISNHEYGGK
jgi:excinuclease UvrABC nuclease subunit